VLGGALPASAATSCTPGVHSGTYTSVYGYITEKAYFTTYPCGDYVQANIQCYNSQDIFVTYTGRPDVTEGSGTASYAACTKSYPHYYDSWASINGA
jgi:hypothetical protein